LGRLVIENPGGITAKATEDGYVGIMAAIGEYVLTFDCTKDNALKLAAAIMDAADELDQRNGRETLQ